MSEHDPLCPCADQEDDACTLISALTGRCISCRCVLIEQRLNEVRAEERGKFVATERFLTKKGEASIPKHIVEFIRADEREKAARRVSEVFWPTDGSWVSEETTFDSMGRAAIAAVRGES